MAGTQNEGGAANLHEPHDVLENGRDIENVLDRAVAVKERSRGLEVLGDRQIEVVNDVGLLIARNVKRPDSFETQQFEKRLGVCFRGHFCDVGIAPAEVIRRRERLELVCGNIDFGAPETENFVAEFAAPLERAKSAYFRRSNTHCDLLYGLTRLPAGRPM